MEYQDITSSFPYQNTALETAPFPKQLPFSAMVPRVYTEVQEFILSCLQFSEDLQLTQAELGKSGHEELITFISSNFTRRDSKEVNKFVTYKDIVWVFKVKIVFNDFIVKPWPQTLSP